MTQKHSVSSRVVVTSLLMSLILIAGVFVSSPNSFIELGFCGDLHNNDFRNIAVYQYNGTATNLVKNFTATGGSERILDSQPIDFEVVVKLNLTLASSTSEAKTFTRANMTITRTDTSVKIWDNVALNQSATVTSDANFYYVTFLGNWTSVLAVAGVTYNCTTVYQAYY